jgi:protein tyrosine phosphatase (PTP) superfamily phosphohydrolase (DUF442 family)
VSALALGAALVLPTVPGAAPTAPGVTGDSARVVALLAGLRNPACPLPGIATGGQPDTAHVRALAAAGFRGVLDLRAADEPRGYDEAAFVRAMGLRYRALPVTPATLTDSVFTVFRGWMQDTTATPLLVHCASGNRVGAVLLPWLVLDRGWSMERALATARAGGLTSAALEQAARAYIARIRR